MHPIRTLLSIALATLAFTTQSRAADDLKAFPPAEDGMTRHVIRLPPRADESSHKVELLAGKTVTVDAANRYFFGGKLQPEAIPGWGYERYVLSALGPMAGTLMAPDPNAPKVERFVRLGEERLLRYNSRLPVVVYVPAGVEVRYRLWRVGGKTRSAPPG